ncbi:MAG: hypothetical protein AAGJ08_11530 [Cyanobacteria bacterium P01_H01_bin.35]
MAKSYKIVYNFIFCVSPDNNNVDGEPKLLAREQDTPAVVSV